MQVYKGRNYATSGEIADIVGMGDQAFRNQVKTTKMPAPTVEDKVGNRRYYAEEYVVAALERRMKREAAEDRADYIRQAAARLDAHATLSDDFKKSAHELLVASNLLPPSEPTAPSGESAPSEEN